VRRDYRPIVLLVLAVLLVGRNAGWPGGSVVPGKVDKVTYVFEKNDNSVPRPVQAALRKLNEQGVEATAIDADVRTGTGEVPGQYRIALAEATDLPALVVQAGERVILVVDDPQTESDVMSVMSVIK